jgi:hypothetical protein
MISWIGRNRRMSRDYERKVQACETPIELVMFRLIPRPPASRFDPYEPGSEAVICAETPVVG